MPDTLQCQHCDSTNIQEIICEHCNGNGEVLVGLDDAELCCECRGCGYDVDHMECVDCGNSDANDDYTSADLAADIQKLATSQQEAAAALRETRQVMGAAA